jgi:hypothetical protein
MLMGNYGPTGIERPTRLHEEKGGVDRYLIPLIVGGIKRKLNAP